MTQSHVTRDVEPAALSDLLAHPPRATVAFVAAGAPELLPALAHVEGNRWCFAVLGVCAPDLAGREVVLVVDDGPYWFQLRGVSVRGTASRTDTPPGRDGPGLAWYGVDARRMLAWDYGSIREA